MNENSNRHPLLKKAIILGVAALFVKLLWVAVEFVFLPSGGVERERGTEVVPLPHTYRLASNESLPKPVKKKPVKPPEGSIRDLKLLATYLDREYRLAVIRKGIKARVVGAGEDAFGYRVESVGFSGVVLSRAGKEYGLILDGRKRRISDTGILPVFPEKNTVSERSERSWIPQEGEPRRVPGTFIPDYGENIDRIWENIEMIPEREGDRIVGFRVREVEEDSVFDRMGLKRGDIIVEADGVPMNDLRAPSELMRSGKVSEGFTLKIKRGREELELVYEVQ